MERKEAIEIVRKLYNKSLFMKKDKEAMVTLIPELKESEDERIVKFIKQQLFNIKKTITENYELDTKLTEAIDWLEKQGEQKSIKNIMNVWKDMRLEVYQQASGNRNEPNYSDDTTKMFSLNDIDEIIEKMSEQKPADKVEPTDYNSIDPHFGKPIDKIEPKFKVGDTIKCKYDDRQFTIKSVDFNKGTYTYTQENCGNDIDYADEEFELVEQKPVDKAQPKFKVGDWITNSIETVQITGYDIDYGYQVDYKGNLQHRDTDIIEKEYHLWTIQDAKDGDVLYTTCGGKNKMIFIYNGIDIDSVCCYCLYSITGIKYEMFNTVCHIKSDICPATKEQRDTLMKAIADAGYEWDFEVKELNKIEKNPTPKFKFGDIIHKIGENTVFPMTIEKIEYGYYVCNNSHSFVNIKFQDDYELVSSDLFDFEEEEYASEDLEERNESDDELYAIHLEKWNIIGECPSELEAKIDAMFGITGRDSNGKPSNGYCDWKKDVFTNGASIYSFVKLGMDYQKEQNAKVFAPILIELDELKQQVKSLLP